MKIFICKKCQSEIKFMNAGRGKRIYCGTCGGYKEISDVMPKPVKADGQLEMMK